MKLFTSFSMPLKSNTLLMLNLFLFSFFSVACAETPTDSLNKESSKYLSFYESVDGEQIHWEVNFFGDEITSIYKNGKRIPDELVSDYKEKIYDELDEMRVGERRFSFRMPAIVGGDFHFDMDELHKELEEMQKELPKHGEHFKFYQFDDEEFKKNMEELEKELKENKTKIYKWKFDNEKFQEEMKELHEKLKESLPKMENFHFYFKEEEDHTEV